MFADGGAGAAEAAALPAEGVEVAAGVGATGIMTDGAIEGGSAGDAVEGGGGGETAGTAAGVFRSIIT